MLYHRVTQNDRDDEAGIVPETEDSTSTAVEPNPVGLVLHVGEVTDRSMMDAAAEDKKKKGVMEVESLLRQTKHHPVILLQSSWFCSCNDSIYTCESGKMP
ncbi:hypothetical protein Prudu_006793 [Prunus dulcis]|uniref:Uncharacterized protein n=1 Tax=Prunus dulcis TaxID=3755 RepID=A0A4Y1R0I9_PRUDU|nr:hypothetical protein Prudu_006793 [Prunus dulcis]